MVASQSELITYLLLNQKSKVYYSRSCGYVSDNHMTICSYHAEHRYLRDISHKHITHKYVCSLRIKKVNGIKILGDSMPCKMCCQRLKKSGIQKIIFGYNDEVIMSHIDEIEKYAVYSSGSHYSPMALNRN